MGDLGKRDPPDASASPLGTHEQGEQQRRELVVVDLVTTADQRHVLMPYTRSLVDSNAYTSTDHARAQAVLAGAAIAFRALLNDYDVVLTPTTTAPPPTTAHLRADDGPGSLAAMAQWSAFTPAANIAGTPGVSPPSITPQTACPSACSFSDDCLLTRC